MMKDGQTIGQWMNWDFEKNGDLEIKDKNGRKIYLENSTGYWTKRKYNSKGKEIYREYSGGYWEKREFDSQGNRIFYENSSGEFIDNRPKPSTELTLESLAEQVLKLNEIVTKFVNKP